MQREEESIENEEVVAEVSRDEREEEATEAQPPQAAPHGPPHPVHQGREEDAAWFQVRGESPAMYRLPPMLREAFPRGTGASSSSSIRFQIQPDHPQSAWLMPASVGGEEPAPEHDIEAEEEEEGSSVGGGLLKRQRTVSAAAVATATAMERTVATAAAAESLRHLEELQLSSDAAQRSAREARIRMRQFEYRQRRLAAQAGLAARAGAAAEGLSPIEQVAAASRAAAAAGARAGMTPVEQAMASDAAAGRFVPYLP